MGFVGTWIAAKQFGWEEQRLFAERSGDFNPMHMDELAARRTPAGYPAVHGMNLALWAMDQLAAAGWIGESLSQCKLRFRQMVRVGESVSLWMTEEMGATLSAEARQGDAAAVSILMVRAPRMGDLRMDARVEGRRGEAREIALDSMKGGSGEIPLAWAASELYPHLTARAGAARVAAMASLSRLVGMECPGLHSIFSSCQVKFTGGGAAEGEVRYQVDEVDERFRLVTMGVRGAGIAGKVVAVARLPPVAQAGMDEIAAVVDPAEFAGATALVIGGSRGLGEVTAKAIAAGGGRVVLTYVSGAKDAEAVCGQIRKWGGDCRAIPYDARQPAAPQLERLDCVPTHAYYFATNPILSRPESVYSAAVFAEFCEFHITGFYEMCMALRKKCPGGVSIFYPSSIFVEERPAGLTEYAMAKAGGEMLCEDLNRGGSGIRVRFKRLPKLLTDQTSAAVLADTANALEAMLPVIREAQLGRV